MKDETRQLGGELFDEFMDVSDIKDEGKKCEQGKKRVRHKLYRYYNTQYGSSCSGVSQELPGCIEIQSKVMFPGKSNVGYTLTKDRQRMKDKKA